MLIDAAQEFFQFFDVIGGYVCIYYIINCKIPLSFGPLEKYCF